MQGRGLDALFGTNSAWTALVPSAKGVAAAERKREYSGLKGCGGDKAEVTPYWQSPCVSLFQADARSLPLEDGCVHCVVTSPPYWMLRRYQGVDERGLGLEATPEEYLENLLVVFKEVKRVLRDDGILWVNLGTGYASEIIFSQECIIREDLTKEEYKYVSMALSRELLRMWGTDSTRQAGSVDANTQGQGDVREVLQPSDQGEIQKRSNFDTAQEGSIKPFPSATSDCSEPKNSRTEPSTENQGNSRAWWPVRLLRSDGTEIPMPGPRQRWRQKGISESQWPIDDLSNGIERGTANRQIQSPLLELQRSPGTMGFLSTLSVNITSLPADLHPFFKPKNVINPLNRLLIPERFALMMQHDGWILRDVIIWAKKSPMPESVSGTRWERCRVQISGGTVKRRGNGGTRDAGSWGEPYRTGANPERPQQDHKGKDFQPSATWADCPGCPKCAANGGLVLRRGSGRTTDAHEYIFLFVKNPLYYYDSYAVRQKADAETVHSLQGRETSRGLLHQQGDEVRSLFSVRRVHEAKTESVLLQPGRSKEDTCLLPDGDCEKISSSIPTIIEQQGSPTQIQSIQKGQSESSTIFSVGESSGQKENLQKGISPAPRSKRETTSIYPNIQPDTGWETTPNPLPPDTKGPGNANPASPEIQKRPEGISLSSQEWQQAPSDVEGHSFDSDGRGMGDHQITPSGQMRLLQEEETPDDGPHHPPIEGRRPYQGQRNSSLSELQLQEGEQETPSSVGANLRSVWSLSPEPYGGPHYATFPTSLPERCILLSTSEAGVCPSCGAQWARVIAEATYSKHRPSAGNDSRSRGEDSFSIANGTSGWRGNNLLRDATQTLGWRPTCACPPQQAIPATVLDPFCGTGTTLLAAQRLGRRSVGVDLSPTYLALAQQRLEGQTLPLVMAKNDA